MLTLKNFSYSEQYAEESDEDYQARINEEIKYVLKLEEDIILSFEILHSEVAAIEDKI